MDTNEHINRIVNRLRRDYSLQSLDEKQVDQDPVKQFEKWMAQAVESDVIDPIAMVLSTVNTEGQPTSRVVLLREFDENGFGFYTNYTSQKGQELAANPRACLNFFWPQLERQIRIEGLVVKQEEKIADEYFASRPKGSKVGAWASPQSSPLSNREELDNLIAQAELKYNQSDEVPRPPHWGGYLVKPNYFEFWQGRQSRLHDRIVYKLENGGWKIYRVAP